jgi:Mg2+-importing ATPase
MLIDDLKEEYDDLSSDGFRVLAIRLQGRGAKAAYSKADDANWSCAATSRFSIRPRTRPAPAIVALGQHGVAVKVLTGDNELVSRKICHEVGIPTDHVLLGSQVEAMTDAELAEAAEKTTLFARLSPAHKQRMIPPSKRARRRLPGRRHQRRAGLRAADVGISVDTAVDIAKESADIILLEKSLLVLEEGVLEGRKVFANILKYVRMGASSNFGNMFSVLGASAFLPFLPMLPSRS